MSIQGVRWIWLSAQVGVAGLLLVMSLTGCDANSSSLDTTEKTAAVSTVTTGKDTVTAPDPRLQQPFALATRAEPPADWQRPPDLTLTGKSVGKLYTEVVRLWDTIRFTSKEGKLITYAAVLD